MTDEAFQEIKARRAAVEHIEIEQVEREQVFYGFSLEVGSSTLGKIWHCTDDRTHEDHDQEIARGVDPFDLYCDGHYPTRDDRAAITFLAKAKEDVGVLVPEVERLRAVERAARELAEAQQGVKARPEGTAWFAAVSRLRDAEAALGVALGLDVEAGGVAS